MGGSFRDAGRPGLWKDAGGASDGAAIEHERGAAYRIATGERVLTYPSHSAGIGDDLR